MFALLINMITRLNVQGTDLTRDIEVYFIKNRFDVHLKNCEVQEFPEKTKNVSE